MTTSAGSIRRVKTLTTCATRNEQVARLLAQRNAHPALEQGWAGIGGGTMAGRFIRTIRAHGSPPPAGSAPTSIDPLRA